MTPSELAPEARSPSESRATLELLIEQSAVHGSAPVQAELANVSDGDEGVTVESLAAALHAVVLRYTREGASEVLIREHARPQGITTRVPRRVPDFATVADLVGEALRDDEPGASTADPLYEVRADVSIEPGADVELSVALASATRLIADFDADRMSRDAVERLLGHLARLLVDGRRRPHQPLRDLDMMSAAERADVETHFAGSGHDDPPDVSVVELFSDRVRTAPDAPAVEGEGRSLTYLELDHVSDRVAAGLVSKGVGRGTIVGVAMSRSIHVVPALLGILKVGAAYLPLDPSYPDARLSLMLEDCRCPLVIAEDTTMARIRSLVTSPAAVPFDDLAASEDSAPPGERVRPDDPAYIIYTSGSTGRPKGIRALHRGIVRLVRNQTYATFEPGDRVMAFAPISFDASTFEIWAPLLNGGIIVFAPPGLPSIADLGRFIEDAGIDTCWLTAALFHQVVDTGPQRFRGVRQLLTGGDVVSPSHARAVLEACPDLVLINGYGPTENTTFTACHRMTSAADIGRTVSIGRPIANTTVHVVDAEDRLVPIGVPGELLAGGAGVADGYLERPDLTAERFVPSPTGEGTVYRTGDLVRWLADGTLEFLGRLDDQVKVDGYRIELGEVEARLSEYPGVLQGVAHILDRNGFRRLVAWVVGAGGRDIEPEAVRGFCAAVLPAYMVPTAVVVLPDLPVTENGKVDRASLPDPSEAVASHQPEESESRSATTPDVREFERYLADLWGRLLGVSKVGLDQGFFDLGGTSLLSLRVLEEIRADHGIEVPVARIYQHATVRALAGWLAEATAQESHSTPAPSRRPREPEARALEAVRPDDDADDRIAIIGMAGRFPGASDVGELWKMLHAGEDGRVEWSDDDLRAAGVPEERIADPDYVKASFPLEAAMEFDAEFFRMLPREVELMDPQQRLFLELAWTAVEHAGHDPRAVPGRVGVFGGVGRNSYLVNNLVTHHDLADILAEHPGLIGNLHDFPTTHVSFRLGFEGPSVDVQTACSTSGVAIHLAAQSLRTGESDMALAGGCKILVPNRVGYLQEEGGALSPRGRIRAFDRGADGMVRGSGGAMLVLKRYRDARADGDRILGVLLGSAVNNDGGSRAGFATPSPAGQGRAIAEALRRAGVGADTIDYVEAHGTGTILGDPIEVQGLTLAFRETTDRTGYCGLGSIKSSIGHLDAGATAAGVIKTLLAFEGEEIPRTLNFDGPNPHIDFERTPFVPADRARPWPRGERPRRAGVSSFGLGGTNAHLVLEEPPLPAPGDAPSRTPQLVVLSARTPEALDRLTEQTAAALESATSPLADVAWTLQTGRHGFRYRRSVVASSAAEAASALRASAPQAPEGVAPEDARVAFLLPGGGAQYVGMAADLHAEEPVFRDAIRECSTLLQRRTGQDIEALLFGEDAAEREALESPEFALPTLFAVEIALARLWASWGVRPDALVGHSMGEYAAAHLAGVLDLEDALELVALRGRLFATLEPGAMLAVPLAESDVQAYRVDGVAVAAVNHPESTVVSGPVEAIERMLATFEAAEIEARRVHIRVAAHSPMVDPILDEFRQFVRTIRLRAPTIPYISNVTGAWIRPEEATDPEYWVRHLRETVRFSDGIESLFEDGSWALLEVGPGRVLGSLARSNPTARMARAVVSSLRHPSQEAHDVDVLLGALGRLWEAGVEPDWKRLHGGGRRLRVGLPTYPYERRHYEIAPAQASTARTSAAAGASAPPVSVPPTRPEQMTQPQRPRRERLVDLVKEILFELSGIEPARIDPTASFLELGFDSLFLAQVNSAFKKRFRTNPGVRRLLDSTPSVNALSEWLDGELPADFFPAETPVAATTRTAAVPSQSTTGAPGTSGGLEDLIQQQLDLMRQQLALMTGGGADTARVPRAAPASPAPASPTPASAPPSPSPPAAGGAHGPWRPVDRERRGVATRQQDALDHLVERLTEQTAASKAFMRRHRGTLADPRSVVGFRSEWKELVYQIVADEARGGRIRDADGNEYVDIVGAFGVNFLGHSPDFVTDAVRAQLDSGFAIGPQTTLAGDVADLVSELTGMERVTFCNTGSEAVLAALRVCRTVTGRDRIATFSSHYHGVFDEVLVKAADIAGRRTNFPLAPGIPQHAVEPTLVLDFGDPAALDTIREHADDLACVIMEPVRSRNPGLQPVEFLHELRALTRELDIPFVFDEMITGFRVHPGGAQAHFGIEADLATYGKIVGGGYPIGVLAGRPEFMAALDGGLWEYGDDSVPEADMTWFAGTFVRHPVALAAAKASLLRLRDAGPELQASLNRRNDEFVGRMNRWFEEHDVPMHFEHFSSFFLPTYTAFQEYSDLLPYYLLTRGVFSRETRPLFWSVAHTDEDWDAVETAWKESVLEMQAGGLMTDRSGSVPELTERLRSHAAPRRVREVPLTEPQREVWVGTRFGDEASAAFNLSVKLEATGALDVPAMERSIRTLVTRHEALRVTIPDTGDVQRIHPDIELEIPLVDLSDRDATEAAAEADALEAREVRTPFDMENGPLVRARILKLAGDRWRVLLLTHHVITDGWACGILAKDLGRLYTADVRGTAPELPPVMQLSEYVRHLHSPEEIEERETSQAFWMEEFETLPPALDFPTDRARPAEKTYAANRTSVDVEPAFVARLREAAAAQGSTLFAFAFAAFDAWLYRLTGQTDLAVGFDLAGQALVPDRELVCHAVSFLPLRARVAPDAPFSDLVREVRGRMFDVIDHQRTTYGSLLQELRIPPDPSRQPLVSVSFNLDPVSTAIQVGELDVSFGSIPRRFENNDLFFNLVQRHDGGIEVQCTYNLDLFDEATARRRVAEYLRVLESVMDDPETTVEAVPLLLEDDRRKLERWNDTDVELPIAPVHRLVEHQAEEYPDGVAVSADAGAAGELTYAELDARADALAARLQKAGVTTDVPVAVSMDRSAELVVSLLAVLKAGGAFVPIDPGYPVERRCFMLEDCGAPVVLTQAAHAPDLPDDIETLVVDEIWTELMDGSEPVEAGGLRDLAYIIYTSGSTGRPKGSMIEHRSVANRLLWMRETFDVGRDEVVLQKTPYSFDVSVWEFFVPLISGGRLHMARPAAHGDPRYIADVVADQGVTVLHFVPSMMQPFVDLPDPGDLESLRLVVSSGEALGPALRDRFMELVPDCQLLNLYGPTEAGIEVSCHMCRRGTPSTTVPIGAPTANTQLHVLDARMRRLPIGVSGDLWIGGVQVGRGYLGRDELTEERFRPDPFHPGGRLYRTGDLARWNDHGEIEFLGREDHQVKVRGFRIELGEIEVALEGLEGVARAVVMARDVTADGPSLVAYLVCTGVFDPSELKRALSRTLPDYMVPTHWVELDEIPVSPTGKVARDQLPMPSRDLSDAGSEEPRGPTETHLAGIWCAVLGLDRVGRDDSFFDLGGHSILATRVVARIRQIFDIDLPLRRIFSAPTLRELADEIDVLRSTLELAAGPEGGDEEEVVF